MEKVTIEEKMKNDPELAQILRSLRETGKEDIVQGEIARRHVTRKSRVDIDLEHVAADEGVGVSGFYMLLY